MKFGPVQLDDALGTVLAHSIQTPQGRVGKGTKLSAADIDKLRGANLQDVTVARLEAGDVDENSAAARLADALVTDPKTQRLRVSRPGTGRVNLFATAPGIIKLDIDRINALNAVDPMITLASVPQYFRVDAGGMVATIKIISYGVSADALSRACTAAERAIELAPAVFKTASLIETQVGTTPIKGKGRAAINGRLERLGLTLSAPIIAPHRSDSIAEALQNAPGDILLILTGSATSDPNDVAPEAVRAAGGTVSRFGMPVDPGNLLFIGTLGGKPVIGLPGCARSPALNGADWVLERMVCGCEVSALDIAGMGVGGLLKEIPTRPQPRVEATSD